VLFVLSRAQQSCTNLGWPCAIVEVGGALVAFAVDEAAQGGQDLDFDGDASGTQLACTTARRLDHALACATRCRWR
jgi:hypothetical protein